jgi:C-terminal processing protease CtpA/Prc
MDTKVVQSSYLGLTKSEKWHYDGRTVALIDERAMSSPEMTAILLKTANGTVLVGSRTAGATGIRTIFSLPGEMKGSYSSSLIEFADGRGPLRRAAWIVDQGAHESGQVGPSC